MVDAETTVERIRLLKVPLDIVNPEELEETVYDLLKSGKGQDVILLSLRDFLKARRHYEYRPFVQRAAMVIPISKTLVTGARFLKRKKVYRYMPFDFVISLLSILEKRELSVYLLGGRMRSLKRAEKNLRQTFPRLRIVGRYVGNFKHQEESTILEAIRKAAPSLLLVGKGVKGGEAWISRHDFQLNMGLRLWCSDLFDVFAERRRRPSRKVFERGFEWMVFCIQKPWRILRIFPFFYYKFLLLMYKIFNWN
ncbi:MAG: WecB/TagA/CpsF family glycosyltransferase [Spirochaetaceae bacterium]|jgi:N-acetylglucosaminyldiphosphoundecaprenol N-acetyl-beta-D-mannosaminyltransferase|nr:WecB/TagA/CpsF family glycosyltransferase [Spirochaetaceae bacterium]